MNPVIHMDRAVLGYGRRPVLREVSFAVDAGEFFGMVGPNGAGKTTVVRAILGTLKPLAGTVTIRGAGGGPPRFGYVPQRDRIEAVLPYTVGEVVMMGRFRGLGLFRRPGRADREAVAESLEHVDAGALRDRPFKELSGGEKQRVLIARALVARPDLLILDEPTNGMDLSSRVAILELIRELHEQDRLTVIMVSHLLDDVATHVRRIALVESGVFQVGSVAEVLTGENLSALYRMDVRVRELEGKTVILARGNRGSA